MIKEGERTEAIASCHMSKKFVVIACLFVSSLLLSNIIAGRLIIIAGQVLPGAVILFPFVYILGDVLTEVYGFAQARLVIWIGFAVNVLMVLVFAVVLLLPAPDFFAAQEAFQTVLSMTPRVVVASLCAYWTGEFVNSMILSKMKIRTRGRWLWTRTIGSTIIGEGVDTLLFISIAFFGQVPNMVLVQMILAQYLFKVGYEILATPFTYGAVGWLKRTETADVYDYGISYNPFALDSKEKP